MPSIADSTWSSEIFSSMNAKALLTSSRISKVVRGLSLAKIKDSICGIRLFISIAGIFDSTLELLLHNRATLRYAQGRLHESTIRELKFVTQLSTYVQVNFE